MATTEKINIVSIIENNICVSAEDGGKVYDVISKALRDGKNVQISFKGIEDLTTLFLNAAIGQLYNEFKEDELKMRLSIVDATNQDLETLRRSVDRAKQYFKNPDLFHSATDEILGEDSE